MGIVLYAPALALEAVSGISMTNAILIIGEYKGRYVVFLTIIYIDAGDKTISSECHTI